jgi:replication factor A1
MRDKASPSEYLAFLTVKYGVDADAFFDALVSAGKNHRSNCGALSIECRRKRAENMVLLITSGSNVVAQFPVSKEFLLNENNPIKNMAGASFLCRHPAKKFSDQRAFRIKDLRIGMKSVSLKAEVVEVSDTSFVVTRFGNYASVANALISDETGKIRLCLWNDQIKSVAVGDTVHIENARVSAFKGEKQLRVGKNGNLRSSRNIVTA